MLDPSLQAAYAATEYRFIAQDTLFTLRIGQPNREVDVLLEQHGWEGLAFVSNFNPRGEKYEDKANGQRTVALQNWLSRQGLVHWMGLGVPATDSDWEPETSFAIGGLSASQARKIARECEQIAFVWHPRGALSQLCETDGDASGQPVRRDD